MNENLINYDYKVSQKIEVLKQTELFGQQFAVYGTTEEPLFLAKDIAKWISHSDPSKMLNMVDDDEKVKIFCKLIYPNKVPSPCSSSIYNGTNYNFLTENGVYEVLMQSNLPIAKQFKKGVKQILKEIRNSGGYIATKAEDTPEEIMAKALSIAQITLQKRDERLKQLELQNEQNREVIELKNEKIKILTPKSQSYDTIMSSQGLVTTNMIAAFIGISAIKLNQLLCSWDVQYKQSGTYFLMSNYRDKGYTKHVPYPYYDNGVTKTKQHMYWTEVGRKFVIDLYSLKCAA